MVQFDVKRVQKGTESFMVSFDFTKTPVTQIADYIIIAASKYGTSDIHFDPRGEGMMVRFRIDGDCQDYTFIPKAYEKNLTTRLKIMANMNITESRLPQDGAIKGNFGDQYLDMRVSSLPLNEGEKIVIRILDYSRSLDGLDSLGFHPDNLEKIKRMMNLPNGIILTTGATGSGKSTTTYSILQGLNKPETNVITVEDPIEMNIDGINQVQVNSEIGMTFAAALRSILRQDPNVILIGEIRDSETAQIAVRASITGHLVLSTIHTNNALATIERLLDMDVERYLLSTALSGIISQRLGKMLCPDCHYQRETTKYEKKVFKKYLSKDVDKVWDANPKGCEHCRKGYHGRIAFHEVLEIDETIRAAISNEKLDKKDLGKMVYVGKTITMLQDALIKCLNGETSFEEVYRNIEIENEDDDNYESEMENEIKASAPVDDDEVATSDDLLETPVVKSEVATASASIPALDVGAASSANTLIPSLDNSQASAPVAADATSQAPTIPAVGGSAISIPAVGGESAAAVQDSIPTVLDNSQSTDSTSVSIPTVGAQTPSVPDGLATDTQIPNLSTPGVPQVDASVSAPTVPEVPTVPQVDAPVSTPTVPEVPTVPQVDTQIPNLSTPTVPQVDTLATSPIPQADQVGADASMPQISTVDVVDSVGVVSSDIMAQDNMVPDTNAMQDIPISDSGNASVYVSDEGVVPIAADAQVPAQFGDLNTASAVSTPVADMGVQAPPVTSVAAGNVNSTIPTVAAYDSSRAMTQPTNPMSGQAPAAMPAAQTPAPVSPGLPGADQVPLQQPSGPSKLMIPKL